MQNSRSQNIRQNVVYLCFSVLFDSRFRGEEIELEFTAGSAFVLPANCRQDKTTDATNSR